MLATTKILLFENAHPDWKGVIDCIERDFISYQFSGGNDFIMAMLIFANEGSEHGMPVEPR